MNPPLGRLPNLPGSEYYPCVAKGSTPIRIASMETVAHYLAQAGKEATPAMRLGNLTHAAVLEPERFESGFVIAAVQQCTAATKKGVQCSKSSIPGADTCGIHGGHQTAELWRESLGPDVEVIAEDEREKAATAAAAVHEGLARLGYERILSDEMSEKEVSYRGVAFLDDHGADLGFRVSTDPADLARCEPGGDGLLVQGRVDLELILNDQYAIADLKGTQLRHLAREESWAWHVVRSGLDIQAALYSELARAAHDGDAPRSWSWVAYESEPPHALRVFDASPDLLDLGHRRAAEGIRRWIEYRNNSDKWAGWPTQRAAVWSPLKED